MAVPQFQTLAQQVSDVAVQTLYENNYSGVGGTTAQNIYIWGVTFCNRDASNFHWVTWGIAKAGEAVNQDKQIRAYQVPLIASQVYITSTNVGLLPWEKIFWLSDSDTLSASVDWIIWQNNQA